MKLLFAAAAATAFMAPATAFSSTFVSLSGLAHHIRDTGDVHDSVVTQLADAPVAVLMHGFAGSTESFVDVAPELVAAGIRCIALDRVGFGRTDRPFPLTLPTLPLLPFRENLASLFETRSASAEESKYGIGSQLSALARGAFVTGLRRPETLAPRLPWQLSQFGADPYSSNFAIDNVLWPLLKTQLTSPSGTMHSRPIYLVGHSAGGPIALRALLSLASKTKTRLPQGRLAGVVLVAPACLDPREDPGAYEREEVKSSVAAENKPETSFLEALVPEDVRARIALETRFATFRAVSNLPDAFGLPGVAKMVDGRDMVEAVVGQMHPRMRANELRSRVEALAEKYTKPTQEFANVWDRALLNVYRADQPSPVSLPNAPLPLLSGRALLLKAKETALQLRTEFLVVTGDSDFVVPVRASRLVAELLGTPSLVEMAETGHLPMDERPEELGKILVGFIRGGVAGASTG